jgi:hypothetical protein
MIQLFFLIVTLFILFTPKAFAGITLSSAGGGFQVPEGSLEGVERSEYFNLKFAPLVPYVVINGNYTIPSSGNVGDVLEITNQLTGKQFIFDSHCSTRKLPPVNLNNLIDPEVFNNSGDQILRFTYINKCPNSKYVDPMFLLFVGGESIGSFLPMMVDTNYNPDAPKNALTDYKQTDPRWGSAHLNNSLNCGSLYSYGCAVTSVADVLYSYGETVLNNVQLDPGSLNNWLANNVGFQGCIISWTAASSAFNVGAPDVIFRNKDSAWATGSQTIDDALTKGFLPILGLNTKFGPHFIAISDKLPDVNGKPDYKIVDPALYPFKVNSNGNTGKALSEIYGGFDSVTEAIIYKPNTNAQDTLSLRIHSPIQLLITDPQGNQTGYDIATQTIRENISASTYGIEPGVAPVDGSAPTMEESKYFQQINPTKGDYKVDLIGTGEGSYTLDILKTDENNHISTQQIKGFAQTGDTERYKLVYTTDASTPLSLQKEVTLDVLQIDIKKLYKQGLIDNKGVYMKLLAAEDVADKAYKLSKQPLGTKHAIAALKAFQVELNKVRGKFITEDGYKILNDDAEALIKTLQGTNIVPITPGSGEWT